MGIAVPVEGILQIALRGLSARQQVTANNIANADTPGFRAGVVRFEDQLGQALASNEGDMRTVAEQAAPRIGLAPGGAAHLDGNTVDLEKELLSVVDTSARYNATARALSQRITLYRSVITDGRG